MEMLDKAAACVVHTKDEIGELAARVNKLYASLLSTIENLEEEKKNVREAEQSKIDFLRQPPRTENTGDCSSTRFWKT